jgi:hypothetical protein
MCYILRLQLDESSKIFNTSKKKNLTAPERTTVGSTGSKLTFSGMGVNLRERMVIIIGIDR